MTHLPSPEELADRLESTFLTPGEREDFFTMEQWLDLLRQAQDVKQETRAKLRDLLQRAEATSLKDVLQVLPKVPMDDGMRDHVIYHYAWSAYHHLAQEDPTLPPPDEEVWSDERNGIVTAGNEESQELLDAAIQLLRQRYGV